MPEVFGVSSLELLAAAANAHVYSGTGTDGAPVAVKILRVGGEAVVRRFERERRAMERLSGLDNIAPVLSSGVTDADEPYLVMPLYAGSVQERLEEGDAFGWEDAVGLLSPISDAVAVAHSHGILHLDIKPANILLDADGSPFLADFGIAEFVEGTGEFSAAMMTPNFSAPERFEDAEPDELADVYALGATLFAMLAGHAPFSTPGGSNAMSTMRRILADPVPLGELPDSVPDHVQEAIASAMAKAPDARTATAIEFAAQLRDDGESTIARPSSMSAEMQSWPDRSKKKSSQVPTSELPPAHKPTASKPTEAAGVTVANTGDSETSGSRTMWLVAAAAIVLAGVVGVLALGGGGDDGGTDEVVAAASVPADDATVEPEEAEATTTTAAATTTEAPETTTTTTAAAAGDGSTTSLAPAGILGEDAQPADGVLTIAGAFPLTGTLKFAGPAPANAMQIAVDEINAAGGVLGVDVEALVIDTKSESEGVFGAFQEARAAGADSVLSGSSESRESIRLAELTALPLISVQSTAPHRYASWDSDYWFGVSGSTVAQGAAIGQIMFDDGHRTAAVISDTAIFREEMLQQTADTFTALGGEAVAVVDYDISEILEPTIRANRLASVIAAEPEAIAIYGFSDQVEAILRELFAAGITFENTAFYSSSGNVTGPMGERFEDSGSLDGLKGVFDGYEIDDAPEIRARLEAAEPLLTYFGDALEAYDATIAVALAAISAESDAGSEIRRHLAAVTGQGTVCTTFATCAELLRAGTDIDYDGVSGPLDLGVHGDPLRSVFTVYELSDDGLRYPIGTVIAEIED